MPGTGPRSIPASWAYEMPTPPKWRARSCNIHIARSNSGAICVIKRPMRIALAKDTYYPEPCGLPFRGCNLLHMTSCSTSKIGIPLEHTLAVNHLTPFLLSGRLEASAQARIVTVSSAAHATGKLDVGDLHLDLPGLLPS